VRVIHLVPSFEGDDKKRSSTSLGKKVHPRQNVGSPMISIVHYWKTCQKFIHEQHEYDVTTLHTVY